MMFWLSRACPGPRSGGNQGTLHEDVKLFLDDPGCEESLLTFQSVDGGHGRIETRTAAISTEIDWLHERHSWPGL